MLGFFLKKKNHTGKLFIHWDVLALAQEPLTMTTTTKTTTVPVLYAKGPHSQLLLLTSALSKQLQLYFNLEPYLTMVSLLETFHFVP